MARKRSKVRGWSYSTGERGRNRVRVYDRGARGLYLDFFEAPMAHGQNGKRVRIALGHSDRELGKAKAEEVAAAFRREQPARPHDLTIGDLFASYLTEGPEKGQSARAHDVRCAAMFSGYFGEHRNAASLSRRDLDSFVKDRRAGRVAPKGARPGKPVGPRVIAYDLRTLLAALNWATRVGDGRGGVLLEKNPLAGLPLPKNESPARPAVTAQEYEALRHASKAFNPRVELFLVLANETGHRGASVRQLRWSDVDLEKKVVRWRAASDKTRLAHETPLTDEAVAFLDAERARTMAIGAAWIFPHGSDPSRPLTKDAARSMWQRLAARAGLPLGERYGWHALRRRFATELKAEPLKDVCELGGWRNPATLLEAYQKGDEATQRAALARRRKFTAAGMT